MGVEFVMKVSEPLAAGKKQVISERTMALDLPMATEDELQELQNAFMALISTRSNVVIEGLFRQYRAATAARDAEIAANEAEKAKKAAKKGPQAPAAAPAKPEANAAG